jgi:hypothetical protein
VLQAIFSDPSAGNASLACTLLVLAGGEAGAQPAFLPAKRMLLD